MLSNLKQRTLSRDSNLDRAQIAIAPPRSDRELFAVEQCLKTSFIDILGDNSDFDLLPEDSRKRLVNIAGSDAKRTLVFRGFDVLSEESRDTTVLKMMQTQLQNSGCIAIDISGMSRLTMGSIVSCAYQLARSGKAIPLSVIYTLAAFSEPRDEMANTRIGTVHSRFSGILCDNSYPKVAVLGLGYERDKAEGAIEYLEIEPKYIWRPNSPESNYVDRVNTHNNNLVNRRTYTASAPILSDYAVMNPHATLLALLDQVRDIANDQQQPVLLPFGPKIFSFLSLLTGAEINQATVWDVVADEPLSNSNTLPSSTIELSFDITL
jgi:hypothetical protein